MKKLLLLTIMCVLGLFGSLRAQEETITIGSGSGAINYSPTYVYNKYSMTQQIFVADEMQEKSGKIKSVAFNCTSRKATRKFQVYMVNTDKTSFGSNTDWVPVTSGDLVYEGNVTFTSGEWTTITFQTPFTYKKGKNVLLCINDITASDQNLVTKYASDTKSENRMLYVNNYYTIYDATNMTVGGTVANVTNQVQFTIEDDGSGEQLDPAPAAPRNLTATALNDIQIELKWDAVEGTTYNVYQGDESVVKGLTTTTYTVDGLTPGTNYCFTVTAAKDLESEKSNEACAETESRATTFAFDFNDGIVDMHVFKGSAVTGSNWSSPKDFPFADMVERVKNYYKCLDGTMAVYSLTYSTFEDATYVPDNYIVTNNPYLITETSTLEWDIRQVEEDKTDQYAIVVSEDGTHFTDIWYERYSSNAGATKAYSLEEYAGKELYIGFHHYKATNGGALSLDNVKLLTDSQLTPEEPIDPTAPTIPDGVKAIAFSESTIKVTWNASENTTSYNIYKGDETVATAITETSYMVENLEAGTQYCFTVTAANEEKESAKSSEACAKTFEAKPATPEAPANLKAEPTANITIKLTWDAVDGAKTYNVYEGATKLITVAEATHTVTGLQAGKEYCFTVTAVNDGGESAKPDEVCATTLVDETIEKPATPQNFTVQALVPGELALTWDAVDGATGYNIYEGDEFLTTLVQTGVDITNLESNKEYCFSVTAVNKGGESDKTDEVCETTLNYEEPLVPAAPQNLKVEALTYNELRLSWDAVDGATKYKVYQFDELLGEISNTTCDIYDLADSTQYCFTVTAVNAVGESAKSEEACGKTLGESLTELNASFNVYPNPVEDRLYVETEANVVEVVVYDVYGRQQTTVNGQQSLSIDVTELNSGIYFVKVVTDNGEAVQRFVKK